jgi:hypothetical protein
MQALFENHTGAEWLAQGGSVKPGAQTAARAAILHHAAILATMQKQQRDIA